MCTGEANYFRDYKRLGVIAKLATSYILAGRFDEQFPRVLAEMLSQEIEAVLNRGEVGFRRRQCQPSFAEKLHHKRFDLVFQEFRRTPCNDEVVRIADQIHFGALGASRVRRV